MRRYAFLLVTLFCLQTPVISQYQTVGNALSLGQNCFRLTPAANFLGGSVWYLNQVNINEPFDLYFTVFLGCSDAGADGIAFVLQPVSTSLGSAGGGLGYQGIVPSIALELDTWENAPYDPAYDHMAVMRNGFVEHTSTNNLAGPVEISGGGFNVEDCMDHSLRVTWNPDSTIFRAYFDCELRLELAYDMVTLTFGGNPNVFWGFTGATGGFNNEQRFCLDYISFTESRNDTTICQGGTVQLRAGTGDTFVWTPTAGLSDPGISNPTASPTQSTTYTVVVTDACGEQRFDTVEVTVEDPLIDPLPNNERLCDGLPIILDASGSNANTFNWSTGDTTSSILVSQPGTYFLTMENACGTLNESINVGPEATPQITTVDVDCFGNQNGQATVSLNSLGSYQFLWTTQVGAILQSNSGPQNNAQLTGLGPGNYLVFTEDGFGCEDTLGFTINQPAAPLSGSLVSQTDVLCNGAATALIALDGQGGTPPYEYSSNGVNFQNGNLLQNLPAGTYQPVIRDANGCLFNLPTVMISEPPLIQPSLIAQANVACNGDANAWVQFTASGGVGALSFSLDGSPFQPAGSFNQLAAGQYVLEVQDSNGCIVDQLVTITEPAPLSLQLSSQQNVDCSGNATGAISVQGVGGSSGYSFSLNGGVFLPIPNFDSLSAGNYIIEVEDDSGCLATLPIMISEPNPLLVAVDSITAIDCFGNASGGISLLGSGGTQPYQFALAGNSFSPNPSFPNLLAGTYTFVVTDDSACLDTLVVPLTEPSQLFGTVLQRMDVDCQGNNTGILEIMGNGGTGPYQYNINGGLLGASGLFDSLFAGFYTLNIRDANGCLASVDTIVSTPTDLVGGLDSVVNILCNGDSTGEVFFRAQGGTTPYTYSINNGPFQQISSLSGLAAGMDTVILEDGNGCIVPIPFALTEPPVIQLSNQIQGDVACFGDSTAFVQLSANGGVMPYAYSLNGNVFQNDSLFTNVPAGNYSASLRDSNQCVQTIAVTISQPPLLGGIIDWQKNVDCFGNASGGFSVQTTGGSGDYQYQLDGGVFDSLFVFQNIAAGTYQVVIQDDSACTDTVIVNLTEPDILVLDTASTLNILCFGDSSGQVDLVAMGGSGLYQFSLDPGPFQADSVFANLPAGSFPFVVEDDSLCSDTLAVSLTQSPEIQLQIDSLRQVDCFGNGNAALFVSAQGGQAIYGFDLNGLPAAGLAAEFSPLIPGFYDLLLTDALGCTAGIDSIEITEPDLLVVSTDKIDVRCHGNADGRAISLVNGGTWPYTYQWDDLSQQTDSIAIDLPIGTYSLMVTDANGCTEITMTSLVQPDTLVLAQTDLVEAFCDFDNGAAEVQASGGISNQYTYAWDSNPPREGQRVENIFGGSYLVTVTDQNLCTDTLTVSIPNTPPAVPFFTGEPDLGASILWSQSNIQFQNQTEGGVAYQWDFGDGLGLSEEENPRYEFAEPGTYVVRLTAFNEFFVCPTVFADTIVIIPDGSIFIPSAFSPNNDGVNDGFNAVGEGIQSL
ncbi:MAG: PKD domain-containing protein, partial [Bacteroidota bacterium]